MQNDYVRIDMALVNGFKGTLKLTGSSLDFVSRKGESFALPLSEMRRIAFRKTSMTTSTLFVGDKEITVCRAHLWAGDMKKLTGIEPESL